MKHRVWLLAAAVTLIAVAPASAQVNVPIPGVTLPGVPTPYSPESTYPPAPYGPYNQAPGPYVQPHYVPQPPTRVQAAPGDSPLYYTMPPSGGWEYLYQTQMNPYPQSVPNPYYRYPATTAPSGANGYIYNEQGQLVPLIVERFR